MLVYRVIYHQVYQYTKKHLVEAVDFDEDVVGELRRLGLLLGRGHILYIYIIIYNIQLYII